MLSLSKHRAKDLRMHEKLGILGTREAGQRQCYHFLAVKELSPSN